MKTTLLKQVLYLPGIIISLLFLSIRTEAQTNQIRGIVSERINNKSLAGANVFFENSGKGTVTDKSGYFTIAATGNSENLIISYIGYKPRVISPSEYAISPELKVSLEEDLIAFSDGVVIVGSHGGTRSSLNSSVPVDQFTSGVLNQTGQQDLSQQINSLAPSFYSTRLTYSDATDHMDPAALRGLNPDQTLILVNGKRHHPSAVVNTLGVVGRGSVINDLNTIPAFAISRVEILRDGASAQYGSDAIAGVINIVLKTDTSAFNLKTSFGKYYAGDGFERNFSANFGFGMRNGGYINLTSSLTLRDATNRAGVYNGLVYRNDAQDSLSFEENLRMDDSIITLNGLQRKDFNLHLGNSELTNTSIFLNSLIPFSANAEFYAFGGLNFRSSASAGDYRLPNDISRNILSLYPNGFLPEISARLGDQFISTGFRGSISDWEVDLSNTFGSNGIDFFVQNSLNASLGVDSPRSFESGGIGFRQDVVNLDVSRKLMDIAFLESLDVSFGGEFRVENYQIHAGEETSWINENQMAYPGAQGFPGYQPIDEVNKSRSNTGIYANAAAKISKKLVFDFAGRFEDYSDFGSNFSGKISSLYSLSTWLKFRGSVSTGFRAPALQQSYYSNTGSYYYFGSLFEILTANNESRVAEAFGIPKLKEEKSVSASFGLTLKPSPTTSFTADIYQVDVNDRIVLSSTFYSFYPAISALLKDLPNVGGAQFFTNAIDTRTRGIDIIMSHQILLSTGQIGVSIAANLNRTEVSDSVKASEVLVANGLGGMLFDRQSKGLLELAQPKSKISSTLVYSNKKFLITLRNVYFGQVSYRGLDESPEELAKDQNYSGKLLTDLKIDFQITRSLTLSVGGNNLFNIYPDKNVEALQHYGRFPYNTAVTQFGFNGGYYYGGLSLTL